MGAISQATRITGQTPVTVYTAITDGTASLDITNCVDSLVTLRVLYTPDAEDDSAGHVLESHSQLAAHGIISRNGLPLKSGWSYTVQAQGDNINLSVLVSGFVE